MLFSQRISGLRREGDLIRIKIEYGALKFHVREIRTISILDQNGQVCPLSALPLRRASLIFTLKSGRKKECGVPRLTMRRYRWVLRLIDIGKHPEIELPEMQ